MRKVAFILIAFLLSFPGLAQESALPLKTILDNIASQHDVSFNYVEDEIVLYKLDPPRAEWPLEKKLDYIKLHTNLNFRAVGKRSYSVYNDKKLDKPLCGFLRDAESQKPIEAASISITGTNVSSVSDSSGYFELPVVSPNRISIRHQNYEHNEIDPTELYQPNCPEIILHPIINSLEEIVAQRYLTTGISKNSDGTFRVTPKNFGILPGQDQPDVQHTMQQLPGINSEDETLSNISVRGGTHDQNLFLWNGIRMFQTGHFFGLISVFNPALPQSVTIVKNGADAYFGESVSSVVDISTHQAKISDTKVVLSADMISVQGAANIKLSPKSAIGFSVRRSYADIVTTPTYVNYRKRIFQNTIVTDLADDQTVDYSSDEHFYFCDFTMQFQQNFGRHNLSVDFIGITNSLIIDQFSEEAEKNNDLGQRNYGASMNWNSTWNAKNETTFKAYVSYYNLNSSTETFSTGQLLEQKNTVFDKGFRANHSWKATQGLTVSGGYQFNETGITNSDAVNSPSFSRKITDVMRTHVTIAEAEVNPNSKTALLRAAIRINYFQDLALLVPELRLQYSQQLSKWFRLEILGEQKSQTMSQIIDRQQDFLGIEKRRWILANGAAYPLQKSNQLSLGVTFRRNNWLVTLDGFYKDVAGITTAEQGFQNQLEFVSASGKYRVLGSELLVQKNFGRYYAWLNYSVNDNRYDFASLTPEFFANNFELSHAVAAAAIYEWESLKIALGAKWHSGRPITSPTSPLPDLTNPQVPEIRYNDTNNTRLPDFFQLDLSASKNWKIWKSLRLEAGMSIVNLLNTKNVVNRFYRIGQGNSSINRYDTFALARTPNIHLKLSF